MSCHSRSGSSTHHNSKTLTTNQQAAILNTKFPWEVFESTMDVAVWQPKKWFSGKKATNSRPSLLISNTIRQHSGVGWSLGRVNHSVKAERLQSSMHKDKISSNACSSKRKYSSNQNHRPSWKPCCLKTACQVIDRTERRRGFSLVLPIAFLNLLFLTSSCHFR